MTDATDSPIASRLSPGMVTGVGVMLLVLGLLAVLLVGVAGLAVAVVIGCAISVGGVVVLANAFASPAGGGRGWHIIGGLIALLAGAFIATHPLHGLIVVTMLLAWYLLLDGVIKVSWAFDQRPDPAWTWTLLSGVASLLMGILIWAQWPSSAAWVVGLIVGINLMLSGWAMIMLGAAAKQMAGPPATADGA